MWILNIFRKNKLTSEQRFLLYEFGTYLRRKGASGWWKRYFIFTQCGYLPDKEQIKKVSFLKIGEGVLKKAKKTKVPSKNLFVLLHSAILTFSWDNTTQGHDYWASIYTGFEDYYVRKYQKAV